VPAKSRGRSKRTASEGPRNENKLKLDNVSAGVDHASAATSKSTAFSKERLDPSRAPLSGIRATNSENVGSQSHFLRQCTLDQSSRAQSPTVRNPNIGGHCASNLLTFKRSCRPQIVSLRPRFSKPDDFVDLVRFSQNACVSMVFRYRSLAPVRRFGWSSDCYASRTCPLTERCPASPQQRT
jgi:hypothetical protein